MTDKEYEARAMRWVHRYLPWLGAFLLLSQVVGPIVNYARFKLGTKVDAQFVSRVHFAASGGSARAIGESSCAYNYRIGEKEHYLVYDCGLLPAFQPETGKTYPVTFYKENPPLILSQVSFAPGWVRLLTLVAGLLMVVLPRVILPRLKNFPG